MGSYHLSEQPVLRPLAKDIDSSEWLDERLSLFTSTEVNLAQKSLGTATAGFVKRDCGRFTIQAHSHRTFNQHNASTRDWELFLAVKSVGAVC
jgi:hypothetical protein